MLKFYEMDPNVKTWFNAFLSMIENPNLLPKTGQFKILLESSRFYKNNLTFFYAVTRAVSHDTIWPFSQLPPPHEHSFFYHPESRDNWNDFCRFSFLGYPKRNNFVPSRSQKETTRNDCCIVSFLPETTKNVMIRS